MDTINALRGQELELNTRLGPLNSYQLSVELYNGQLMFNEEIFRYFSESRLICLNVVNVQFKMVETCPMVELSRDALSFSTLPSHVIVIQSIFSYRIPDSYVADEAEHNQTFTVCLHITDTIQQRKFFARLEGVYTKHYFCLRHV